jgi:hypothetical protein
MTHCADPADRATEYEELLRKEALARRAPSGPVATGECLDPHCAEPLPEGRRWCDADCRDAWERANPGTPLNRG